MHNHADSKGQPAPTGNGKPVTVELIHDLLDRREIGVQKYGHELKAGNGRRPLIDAYQEAMDLAMYLKQAVMEEDDRVMFTDLELAVLLSLVSPEMYPTLYRKIAALCAHQV